MKPIPMPLLLVALALWVLSLPRVASAQQRPETGAPRAGALDVFLDCSAFIGCDFDYVRTEITYVNYVRDRQSADVHVLVTTQRTGSGGTEFTLTFIGQRAFAGMADTLVRAAAQTDTPDEVRRALAHTIKVGLVRYIARTPQGARLAIGLVAPTGAAATAPGGGVAPRDAWNYWVFTTSLNGNVNGERTQSFAYVSGRLAANRTTEDWKMSFAVNTSYNRQEFRLTDSTSIRNVQRDRGFDELVVKSLGPRWSAGLTGGVSSSVFLNQRLAIRATPAVEFDLFPYSEATRRQLRIQYGAGVDYFAYGDTTIYFKTEETLPVHTLSVAYSVRQPWGSTNVGAFASSYLNDGTKRRVTVNAGANLRIVKGLNLNFSGSYSSIHDQLYLKKGAATEAEVLLRQRQLLTSYRYFGFVGLSYTFGSIFNNVVNPRFGSGRGGETIIFF